MGEAVVDAEFVQETEHRANPLELVEVGADEIPLIDLSSFGIHEIGYYDPLLVQQIGDPCREWGFFQVINHGVAGELRRRMESAAKRFFDMPSEEKKKVRRDEVNPMGYYDTERTKNVRDWKEVFDITVENPTILPAVYDEVAGVAEEVQLHELRNQWPDYPPEFREVCEEYARALEKLSYKLLEIISLGLSLPPKRLNPFFKHSTSFIRLNHYPPCPSPELALGVGRHKDSGALTILAQDDIGGLEVKRKTDGEWVRVKPIPDAYIVNVGDIIQVWSNDKYQSVEHRATVNSNRERFSIPFFFNPAHHVTVKPLEELTHKDNKNPPKYKAYNWGKFFMMRTKSNFKKLDVDNIQIHHLKISE